VTPAEPTSHLGDHPPVATIEQRAMGIRGYPTPHTPLDVHDPSAVEAARAKIYAASPDSGQPWPGANARPNVGLGWPLRPEVLDSCSVALRRMGDSHISSLAVTSTLRGEGRTTIAAALAATASTELHRHTVLVDLDLERSGIEKMTSATPGPGVFEFLNEEASIDECIQPVGPNTEIMIAGAASDHTDLAARLGRLAELIEQLRGRCDFLVADLPPLSSGATAARIADLFEAVTLVVRAGGVAVPVIEQTVSVLSQRPFVILNRTTSPPGTWLRRVLRTGP
jgi:Mrp family chromosome partitioning ATPase